MVTRALDAAEHKGVLRDRVPFLRAGFRAADELRRDYELLFCTQSTWRDPPASYESVSTEAAVTQRQVLALGCVSNRRDAGVSELVLSELQLLKLVAMGGEPRAEQRKVALVPQVAR